MAADSMHEVNDRVARCRRSVVIVGQDDAIACLAQSGWKGQTSLHACHCQLLEPQLTELTVELAGPIGLRNHEVLHRAAFPVEGSRADAQLPPGVHLDGLE